MKTKYIIARPSDEEQLRALKSFLEELNIEFEIKQNTNSAKEYLLTDEQIDILEERKEKHIRKESKSFSWDEIKDDLKKSTK
jgi:hypothetical protein